MTLIDLAPRFQAAYGSVPLLTSNDRNIPGGQYVPITGARVYNIFDTDFEDITLSGNGTELYFAGGELTKSGVLGNVFAPPVMMGFRKSKKLITTTLDGDDGDEVVERYNGGSWEIVMQGIIVDME